MGPAYSAKLRRARILDMPLRCILHNGRAVRHIEQPGKPVTIAPPQRAASLLEADTPHSLVAHFDAARALQMDAGVALGPLTIAYQTYGELNEQKSNAVLVCHALTGDQHVANVHPLTGKPGWWQAM